MATEQAEWSDRPADHYLNRLGQPTTLTIPKRQPPTPGPLSDAEKDPEQHQRSMAASSTRRNR